MTRYMLAILSLPLAFVVGCGDPSTDGTGDNTGCEVDCVDDTDFAATLRSVAPYGWVGDHRIFLVDEYLNDPDCVDVNECDKLLDAYGNYRISLQWDTWDCVHQEIFVSETDDDETVSVSDAWLGEGICGLAPEGEDAGWDVDTDIKDYLNGFDQVTITIDNYGAVVTEDTFFFENDEYLLEGWIAEDLSEVYFHRVLETGETERTLELE